MNDGLYNAVLDYTRLFTLIKIIKLFAFQSHMTFLYLQRIIHVVDNNKITFPNRYAKLFIHQDVGPIKTSWCNSRVDDYQKGC